MKESYLHLIWEAKRLPFHLMRLADDTPFQVIDPGKFNRSESGPDFLDAKIRMDGILWVGPVEIHVKASDWLRHQHQYDGAYNNVILHVVFENDCEIVQDGRKIMCLELKNILDEDHFDQYKDTEVSQKIPCGQLVQDLDPIHLWSMVDKVLIERLERKHEEIEGMFLNDEYEVLIRLLARSFGSKVNALPFDELAIRLSTREFRYMSSNEKRRTVGQVSGLFASTSENELHLNGKDLIRMKVYNIGVVNPNSWKYKGLRPPSFPDKRIKQFAEVISKMDFNLFTALIDPATLKTLILIQFEDINTSIPDPRLRISKNLIDLIIINCFVPFVFWQGKKNDRPDVCQNAVELLGIIKPEKNYVVNKWRDYGFHAKNALDSQGLLELHNRYCIKKKCLNCAVGNKIMRR